MKLSAYLFGVLVLCTLSGCGVGRIFSPAPWHFNADTDTPSAGSGKAPQAFIDQANQDFATIMTAYETGVYPAEFDNRFAEGPTVGQNFVVRSYFDPHIRHQEIVDQYKNAHPWIKHSEELGSAPIPIPVDEWKEGYFDAQDPSDFAPQFPHNLASGMLTFSNAVLGTQTNKLYGFIWKNDFGKSMRAISASPYGISFLFTWRRYIHVPVDVSMTNELEENASVNLDYNDSLKLTNSSSFAEIWGVAPLH